MTTPVDASMMNPVELFLTADWVVKTVMIGLAAAIPAYIAYNKFSIDAGKFTGRLESFADDLQAAVARRLGGGSAPVAPPPPPPPSAPDLSFRRSV